MKAAGKGMKSKRALKAALCLICSLLLALSLNPAFAIASTELAHDGSSATGASQSSSQDESQTYDGRVLNDGDKTFSIEEVNLDGIQSSKTMSLFSNASTSVGLKETNATNWFDRVAFPNEFGDTFEKFYKLLDDSCDNDGSLDFLIEDKYVTPGATQSVSGKFASKNNYTALEVGIFKFSDDWEKYIKSNLFNDCARAVIAAFDRDHPEVFWLGGSTVLMTEAPVELDPKYMDAKGLFTGTVFLVIGGINNLDPRYEENIRSSIFKSETDIKDAIVTRETQVQKMLAEVGKSYTGNGVDLDPYPGIVDAQYTDSNVVRIFNKQLVTTNSYNSSNLNTLMDEYPLAYECVSALEGNVGAKGPVCEGYARAFKVLCDAVGINCVLTDGDGNGEPHMWNYVEIGGSWYAVDVTWNDPGKTEVAVSGLENEAYLLVGADTVSRQTSRNLTFLNSHVVENIHFVNGLRFINGPVLSKTAFVFGMKSPLSTTDGADVSSAQISGLESAIFNKSPVIQSNVKATLNGVNLQNGSDYVYDCLNNVNPGQAEVRICGRGNYFGSGTAPFTIYKAKVEARSISVGSVTYNGKAQKPKPNVVLTNSLLKEGEDYSISTTYTNNVNAGTANAKVFIRGINSCEGEVIRNVAFTIKPASIGSATATTTNMVYTGKALTPNVTIRMANQSLVQGTHYSTSIVYSNNKNVGMGTATVTIKGIGNYGGTIKCNANFTISPKKMKLSKLLSKKKSFVAKWSKAAKAWSTGYQIRYSTNSKLKSGVKTSTVSGYSKSQATIKKLKSKKTYYVQIRAYKTVGGVKYYGEWSASKKVRAK